MRPPDGIPGTAGGAACGWQFDASRESACGHHGGSRSFCVLGGQVCLQRGGRTTSCTVVANWTPMMRTGLASHFRGDLNSSLITCYVEGTLKVSHLRRLFVRREIKFARYRSAFVLPDTRRPYFPQLFCIFARAADTRYLENDYCTRGVIFV